MICRGRHPILMACVIAACTGCGGKVVHEVGSSGSTGGAAGGGAQAVGAAGNGASGFGGSDSGGSDSGGQGFGGFGPGGGGVGGAVSCPPDAPMTGDPCPVEGMFCDYPGFCMGFTCFASGWVPPPC